MSDRPFLDRLRDSARSLIRIRGVAMVNDRPIVSFTFDGFRKSAVLNAATLLESRGVAGTYYTSHSFCSAREGDLDHYDPDDLRRLMENGHEIGSFTGRPRTPQIDAAQLTADVEANAEFIRAHLGDLRMTTFAFPFADIDLRTKLRMQTRFAACRSTSPGVNAGVADLGALRAEPLFSGSTDAAAVKSLIASSSRPRSWLIFFTRDVDEMPSPYGCTPALFEHTLETALAMGCEVLSVRNALGRIRFRAPSQRKNSASLQGLGVAANRGLGQPDSGAPSGRTSSF